MELVATATWRPRFVCYEADGRSRWPRRLRLGHTSARLLGLRVRIPPGAWMSVCYECCVSDVAASD